MYAPAAAPSRRSARPVVLAGIAGLLLGSLIVGLIWLTTDGSGGGSGDAPAAPASLETYHKLEDLQLSRSANGTKVADRTTGWNGKTAQQISAAYHGAGATVQTYASDDLQQMFALTIVRAESPGLYVPYEDPAELGLAVPEQELKQFGDVQCSVRNQPTAAGSSNGPQVLASDCQETAPGLTVRIANAVGDLGEHPDQVAALVAQAWSQLH